MAHEVFIASSNKCSWLKVKGIAETNQFSPQRKFCGCNLGKGGLYVCLLLLSACYF